MVQTICFNIAGKRLWFSWVLTLVLGTAAGAAKAPAFTLADLEGKTFSLAKEVPQGPILFDFWATWCKPCIKSLGKMQKVAEEYKEKGVRVYTINIDGPRSQAKIRPFLKRHKLTMPVLLDPTNQVMKQYHLIAPPAALLVDANGDLVYSHQGYKPGGEKAWRAALDQLLKKQQQKTSPASDRTEEKNREK